MSAQETQRGNSSQPLQTPTSNQESETGRRSIFSTITSRIGGMRERERQAAQATEQEIAQGRRDRLLRDLNRLRDATIGRVPFQYGDGRMFTGNNLDLEAQNQLANNASETTSSSRKGTSGKSRREKEEGAALFGPNLANYFGSGSSSSGAVLNVTSSTGADSSNNTAWTGSQRKARLGSRGRARGASLSGLLPDDIANSVTSLPEQNSQRGETSGEFMAMVEGIELDTIKRWIDRSVTRGALEIPSVDGTPALSDDGGNSLALCSTLQSYVNLKRNTVKLNVFSGSDADELLNQANQLRSPTLTTKTPPPTHLLQFEYDCASPNAIIQVFARASRKHGSWVSWAATRESLGLLVDLHDGDDDVDSRFYAQKGPPPHVLGWPVYASRLKRGFGRPLKAAIALQLGYYAPPKADQTGKATDEEEVVREPETPGLDGGKILGEDMPATPTITSVPVPDPFTQLNSASTTETKEEKAAREKAERETLKLTLIVEALDEDGKPLGEPNLQTTYLRVASLPIGKDGSNQSQVDASNVVVERQISGHIQDVAISLEGERKGQEILATTNSDPLSDKATSTKRIWTLQVEGQEAEIGPHRFQLQELYGLSSRPPPPNQEEHHDHEATEATEGGDVDVSLSAVDLSQVQDGNATECLICLSSPPTTLLLPCTHGLCLECAVQLRESVKAVRQTERRRGRRPKRKYACPVCRRGE